MYNNGINKTGEILDLGVQLRVICKQGAEYSFKGQNLGSKRIEALIFLKQKPSMAREIEQIIRQILLPNLYPAAM